MHNHGLRGKQIILGEKHYLESLICMHEKLRNMLPRSYVIREALQTEKGIEVTESILKCNNMLPSLTELTEKSIQVIQVTRQTHQKGEI